MDCWASNSKPLLSCRQVHHARCRAWQWLIGLVGITWSVAQAPMQASSQSYIHEFRASSNLFFLPHHTIRVDNYKNLRTFFEYLEISSSTQSIFCASAIKPRHSFRHSFKNPTIPIRPSNVNTPSQPCSSAHSDLTIAWRRLQS